MAGTQNSSGGGNNTSTNEGLDEKTRKKYGDHLVYSAELNYFAEMIYGGKLVGRISFRWTSRSFPLVYFCVLFLAASLFECTWCPSLRTIGWVSFFCLLIVLVVVGFRIHDFLRDLTSLDNVKELYQKAKLSENKADFYLDQAHKNLTLFFTFLSASSAAVVAVSGIYFEKLSEIIGQFTDSQLSTMPPCEGIIPFLLLVISMNGLFISVLFASTMKHFFLVKALKLIVANQP